MDNQNVDHANKGNYRLDVSNFGPIVQASLELRPLTVFIGPSNTGKSYLAILIYALHRCLGGLRNQGIHRSTPDPSSRLFIGITERGGFMPTSVRIPVQLRTLTGGQEVITGTGGTVQEIIEDIDRQYPGLKDRICESEGKVRRFVNIFLNEEDIRFLENLGTPVTEKDELSIIPAIAGG